MALRKNYEYKLYYCLPKVGTKEIYKNILSEEEFLQISDSIIKSFIIQNAYCKIENVNGSKENVEIKLIIYKDENKDIVVSNETHQFAPDISDNAPNFIKQGYEYLKTLEEFKDAIDC